MTDLIRFTAADTAAAIATGDVSAVEVAQAHLDRIDAVDAKVHAFLHVDTEGALAAYLASLERLLRLDLELIAPGHCTGWRAQHTLATMLPDAWVQTSVGTTYTLSAA